MTTKLQYLKECVKALSPLEDKRWYIGLLSSLLPSTKASTQELELTAKPQGMFYLKDGQEVLIVDSKPGTPLYHITDKITIDSSWLPHISKSIETTVGRLILNAAAIYPAVGTKIAYINTPIKIRAIESQIALKMKDDKDIKDPSVDITVQEYLTCMDRLWFFTKLSNLITVASTPKTVLPPPGINDLRKKLLADNEGKLSDPVVVATIANTLLAYDSEYLKDDPSAKFIIEGKGKTARKKLFHFYGETNDFGGSLASDPITSTMQEGIDTSEDVLPKYINDLRYASYSRGHSTQLSGYSYKILQRSLSGVEISGEHCGTKQGLDKLISKPEQLLNRYVRADNQWLLIDSIDKAGTYLGKLVKVKSPMYCIEPGNAVCYSCLGATYKGNKNAINNIAAGFSGELMSLFLKRMHTSGFNLTNIKVKDLVT